MAGNSLELQPTTPASPEEVTPAPSCRGTVAIHTHGCKLNQADSSVLARQFRQAGYRLVETAAEADIYVLNTCTVTATADAKARQALRAARRANPDALVVAAGCYPQRASEELARLPAVSLVVGNTEKSRLVSLVTAAHQDAVRDVDRSAARDDDVAPLTASGNLPARSRAMVKIQEGCDQVCAYCIVPKVRGRERSIPPEELVNQIRQRVGEGCREVVLTGTQLGTYGFDIPGANLPYLLRRILAETDVARLRVSSLQPQEINAELLQIWLEDSRLCSHFHVPLQSGSDSILKTMRRQYTRNQFAETVELIRQAIPDAGITADFIVGFPGEGDREFEESLAFVKAMGFSDMHVFPYSKRPGTSAAYLNEQVPEAVKKERMGRMLELARQGFERFRRVQLGQTRPVLWEPVRPNRGANRRRGLTDNYIRVHALDGNDAGLGKVAAKLDNAITPARLVELSDTSVLAQPV